MSSRYNPVAQSAAPLKPRPPGEQPASRDDMTEVLSELGEIRLVLEDIRTLMRDTRKG
jgi:hypothetical protein